MTAAWDDLPWGEFPALPLPPRVVRPARPSANVGRELEITAWRYGQPRKAICAVCTRETPVRHGADGGYQFDQHYADDQARYRMDRLCRGGGTPLPVPMWDPKVAR